MSLTSKNTVPTSAIPLLTESQQLNAIFAVRFLIHVELMDTFL